MRPEDLKDQAPWVRKPQEQSTEETALSWFASPILWHWMERLLVMKKQYKQPGSSNDGFNGSRTKGGIKHFCWSPVHAACGEGRHLKRGQQVNPAIAHWTTEPKLLTHPPIHPPLGQRWPHGRKGTGKEQRASASLHCLDKLLWAPLISRGQFGSLPVSPALTYLWLLRERMLIARMLMAVSHHFCICSSVAAVSLVWLLPAGIAGPLTWGTGTHLTLKQLKIPAEEWGC